MNQDSEYKRWYDFDSKMALAINKTKKLSNIDQEALAESIIAFINILRESKETVEPEEILSLGKDRVLGLFKSSDKKRWYDDKPLLKNAMSMLSTLPASDVRKVAEGILQAVEQIEEHNQPN